MSTKSLLLALALATLSWPAAAQPPLISSPASGTLGLDPEAALSLAWTTVPNATSYRVELSEHPSFQPLLPLKDAQVPAQPGRLGQSYLVQFTDDTTLQPGRRYYWRVSAEVNGASTTSTVATFTTASDPFRWLANRHFSLTRAEDGVDKDKPATIGFIRQGGDTPTQQLASQFLLGWQANPIFAPPDGSLVISPSFAFAGNITSDKDAEDTLAKAAGGLVLDWSFGDRPTRSLYQTVDLAYEGDQSFDDPNLLLDYLLTYSGPGVGRFYPTSPAAAAQILVRPYLLVAFARKLDAPDAADHTQTRVGPQVDLKVRVNVLARALGIAGSLLSITERWYVLSGYPRDDANYFIASLDFQVAKGVTFGYSYRRGYDAPAFKGVNRMALTIGLGFGE